MHSAQIRVHRAGRSAAEFGPRLAVAAVGLTVYESANRESPERRCIILKRCAPPDWSRQPRSPLL